MAGKSLPRRTVLRGIGTAIALPVLDAMTPALAAPATTDKPTRRMAFVYVPNGIVMKDWTPATDGDAAPLPAVLPRILEPLAAYRDRLLLLSGPTLNNGRDLGDGPGDHARAAASYLTGAHPKKTYGADMRNGISVDQIAAQKVGSGTRLASLELGCEEGILSGNCDNGYSCAYSNSLSWRTANSPLPPEIRAPFLSGCSAAARIQTPAPCAAPAPGVKKRACSILCWPTPTASAPRWARAISASSMSICSRCAISKSASKPPNVRAPRDLRYSHRFQSPATACRRTSLNTRA